MSLATIKIIDNLEPIENADAIEKATVEGWSVVVKKGEFQIGDLCVYIEIDTVAPEKPEFEFLRPRGFRIKTIRLKKVLSQGIVFPMSVLPHRNYYIGEDVTDIIGITKYERPLDPALSGIAKGNFPGFISKTDETMIQSVKAVIEELKGNSYYISTKIDGTSATYFYHETKGYGACSRRLELCEGDSIYWQMGAKHDLANKLKKYYDDHGIYLTIQGEIAGPGIQKNRLELKEHQFFVFNVFNITTGEYFDYYDMLDVCLELGLQTVPIEETGNCFGYTLEELLEKAKGNYPSGQYKEGIVIRPMNEMYSDRLHGRLSFKVISNDFLEKGDK
jgi:RNA ligase (TIGR02306 family)